MAFKLALIIFALFTLYALSFADNVAVSDVFTTEPNLQPYFVREHDSNTILACVVNVKYAQEPYNLNWVKIVSGAPRILTTGQSNRDSDSYELDTSTCSGCYNLHIKSVTYARDNGEFFCQVSGPNNFDKSTRAAKVIVLVKPGSPLISTQPVGAIREGTTGRVDCQSAGGNPPPTIRWYFSNGTEATRYSQQTNASSLNSPTTSSLQWPISASENGAKISCKVWNEAMGENATPMETGTTPLSVLYPPRVSVGPVPIYSVELGAPASLYCSADSNPPPTRFNWYLNGNVQQSGTNFTIPSTAKNSAGNYTCIVNNEDSSGQDTLTLNVLYSPEITMSSEYHGVVGKKATLVCTVDANPPPTSVVWTGPNGLSADGPVYEINSVSMKDMGNYTCTAKNLLNLYSTGNVPRTATKISALIVDHPPGKAVISTVEPVVAGSTANLSCTTDDLGSPKAEFKWKAPGQQDFEHASRANYVIYDVQMTHAGDYSCLPWNSVGDGKVGTYTLTVYEPAHLDQLLKTDDVKNEGDTGYSLTCSARGHPAPNITWSKEDEVLEENDHWTPTQRIEQSACDVPQRCSYKTVSVLQWKDGIKWSDKGSFSCTAFNGAGRPTVSSMNLKVFHKAVIINNPKRPYVAADVGRSVEIDCKSSAKPDASFVWMKDNKNLNDSGLYSIVSRRNESFDVYESSLTIKRVQESDMGSYVCKAINIRGEDSFTFTVQPKTKPMIPENLRTVEQTHRWLLLSWTAGYDGGSPQTFTVEVVYPAGLPVKSFNVSEASVIRYKRHVGIEKANSIYLNVSADISPSNEYKFRVSSKNDLGTTDWTPFSSVWSEDAPLNTGIQKPTQAIFNTDTLSLEFKPENLDPQLYCLLIYRKEQSSNRFVVHSCVDPTGKTEGVPPAEKIQIRFCLRQTLTCGEAFEVIFAGFQASIGWEIIAAIVAAAVFLAIVALIGCCFCRRCKRFKGDKKKPIAKINGLRKDYEMETNNIRPKAISGPYLTEKTPGPASGLGSMDQNTGSSKDSGVFTTGSNYRYDPNGYVEQEAVHNYPHINGNLTNGRPPSYDDREHWVQDGYGLNNSYLHPADYPDAGDVNRAYDAGGFYDPSLAYPDHYNHRGVDMNPNPNINQHHDGSLNSAYSTPSQRRIIREIIV